MWYETVPSPSKPVTSRVSALIDSLPPVLSDPVLAKATYEGLEKEVEKGVKAASKGKEQ